MNYKSLYLSRKKNFLFHSLPGWKPNIYVHFKMIRCLFPDQDIPDKARNNAKKKKPKQQNNQAQKNPRAWQGFISSME